MTGRRRSLFAMLILSLAAACGSAPKRKPPALAITLPEEWTAGEAGGDSSDARWWVSFGDLDLSALIEEALGRNHDLLAAAARVDAAAAEARVAGADLLPHATFALRGSRQRQNFFGFPIPGREGRVLTIRSTTLGVSLDTDWEIDLWGRIRAGRSAALADLQASRADLAAARLSIAAQTAKAWFALCEARLQLELAEGTVASYRASAAQIRRRYQQGVRPSLDLRLSLSNLAGGEALLEQRKGQLDRVVRQLEILVGRYPAGALSGGKLPSLSTEVPAGLPSELLYRRPDLIAAERRLAAAGARVSQSRRALLPQIPLTASGGTLSEELNDLLESDFQVWSIAGALMQPLFQGGKLRAQVARSEALSDQAVAQYAGALLRAFGEVESVLFSEEVLARRESHVALAADQSEAARRLAERQYEAGLVNYITVLETQRRALASRSELLAVRRLRLEARVNLHLALGGGFDVEADWDRFLRAGGTPEREDSIEP